MRWASVVGVDQVALTERGPNCEYGYADVVRVLVAMSGGVDSSVAAAAMLETGHEVVGATLKLWGGRSDSGCCSLSDVHDARRVAETLGIRHHVFNFTELFEGSVVSPYTQGHLVGQTPNPCIECNRHVKFGVLLERAVRLGFDALATGHHAKVEDGPAGRCLLRGQDRVKDQSYVLSMLTSGQLSRIELPIGEMTKAEVRERAARLGLRTATKPDSQDVCFISSDIGRGGFLSNRSELHEGELVDAASGEVVGRVPAVELVTVGQRRGLGTAGDGQRRFAVAVDITARRVTVAPATAARSARLRVANLTWVDEALLPGSVVFAQTSAHGRAFRCTWCGASGAHADVVIFDEPQRLVAPGQTVAFYDRANPDRVVGSATVTESIAA